MRTVASVIALLWGASALGQELIGSGMQCYDKTTNQEVPCPSDSSSANSGTSYEDPEVARQRAEAEAARQAEAQRQEALYRQRLADEQRQVEQWLERTERRGADIAEKAAQQEQAIEALQMRELDLRDAVADVPAPKRSSGRGSAISVRSQLQRLASSIPKISVPDPSLPPTISTDRLSAAMRDARALSPMPDSFKAFKTAVTAHELAELIPFVDMSKVTLLPGALSTYQGLRGELDALAKRLVTAWGDRMGQAVTIAADPDTTQTWVVNDVEKADAADVNDTAARIATEDIATKAKGAILSRGKGWTERWALEKWTGR
jgi:hypothetical protein